MTIAVTTPTGNVGRRVVTLLLQAGVRPRVLLRDVARLEPEVRARVDAMEVDQGDEEAVAAATEGVEALFWVDPPTPDSDPVAGYARMGAVAARAVVRNVIPHVVFQSSIGAEKRSGAGEIDGLARTEEVLDATGASVLHLRCGYFYSNLAIDLEAMRTEGVLRTPWPLDAPMPWVDPRDIGDVVAGRLLSRAWSGRVVQAVHGPEDMTFRRAAAILGAALGREVRAEQMSDAQFRAVLRDAGLGEDQVDGIAGMAAGLATGFVAEDERSVLTTTPTTLASWAAAHLTAAHAAA